MKMKEFGPREGSSLATPALLDPPMLKAFYISNCSYNSFLLADRGH